MPVRVGTAARNAACDAIVDLIDLGAGGNGILVFFNGTQPANPQTAHGSTKLSEHAFSATAFGNSGASNPGEAIAAAIGSDTALASGTANWGRIYDTDGDGSDPSNSVLDFDCGEGAGSVSFDDADIVVGGTVNVTALTVTVPQE